MANNNFSLKVAKVLGISNESLWSQIHFFTPKDPRKKEKRGSLLAVFSAKSPAGGFRPEYGKELITRLQEEYYGHEQGWPMPHLVASLEKLAQEIADNQFSFEVGITAGVFWHGVWYFAILGKGKVLVKRGPTLSAVLTGEGAVVSSSGKAEEGDLVILGTEDFFQVSADIFQKAIGTGDLRQAAETIAPVLLKEEKNGAAAGLLIKLGAAQKAKRKLVEKRKLPQLDFSSFSKKWLLVGSAVLVILLSSGGFFLWQRQRNKTSLLSDEALIAIEKQYQEAKAIVSLDKEQAGKILQEAKENVASLPSSTETEARRDLEEKINLLLKELEDKSVVPQKELPLFLDLTGEEKEITIGAMALLGEKIYLLDRSSEKIYQLGWQDKEIVTLVGDEKIKNISAMFARTGGLVLLSDNGIYEIKDDKLDKVIEVADEWGEISDIYGWLGNLYLLDVEKDMTWQYPAIKNGYGAIREWNKEVDLPDWPSGSSLTVDGSIWVTAGGKIYQYYKGYQENVFTIEGLGNETLLYTTADFDNLYLVDKNSHRFLVVEKESGEIKKEIKGASLKEAKGLIVSSEETVALIAVKDKLYQI